MSRKGRPQTARRMMDKGLSGRLSAIRAEASASAFVPHAVVAEIP